MEESSFSSNDNKSISVSRNRPLAFLVGVAGFLGSQLAEELLKKDIQVIGIDDLSLGSKDNLKELVKDKNFHFLNEAVDSIEFSEQIRELTLPRLDYGIFVADSLHPEQLYSRGLLNFLNLAKKVKEQMVEDSEKLHHPDRPKVVLVSSIELYEKKLDSKYEALKDGEIRFARFIKQNKLNARVVRLSEVFGPKMNFRLEEPLTKLIQASLSNELPDQQTSLDFTTRALYVKDAVSLILKSILGGSTAEKIYDGALIQPIKLSEIKQILLDPDWHEAKDFKPTELPPFKTPNLDRTVKELGWEPKENIVQALKKTVNYFKTSEVEIPKIDKEKWREDLKRWSFTNPDIRLGNLNLEEKNGDQKKFEISQKKEKAKEENTSLKKRRNVFSRLLIAGLIIGGLVLPIGQLVVGGLTIRQNLKVAQTNIARGDFEKAKKEIKLAKTSVSELKQFSSSLTLFARVGILSKQIGDTTKLISAVEQGIGGIEHAVLGTESLFKTTKVISGEQGGEVGELYLTSQIELTSASQKIDKLRNQIKYDLLLSNNYPAFITTRLEDLEVKLESFAGLVDKARSAAFILPEITAVGTKKAYLILLQNNLELRPGGGFIGSYGRLIFENGKISNILVDDIYNLDGRLSEVIAPPPELKSDLGQNRLYLRDSNYEPDFPTSARTAQVFYKKEAGENVNGVIAMDLTASGKLIDAVSGLELADYGEKVTGANLFERSITHAEVGFFPGSQAKKNYVTSLQTQLFNKLFYLSNQNWPKIIQALADSLEEKHLLIYLADPNLFSYTASQNWSGVMPRGVESRSGETRDFLAVVESNLGANKANYYLERKYKLETAIGKEGQIFHKLVISYKNNSPSEVFPGGKYKNRFKIYLPLGTKLNKAVFGEADAIRQFLPFTDYGRSGFSAGLIINPKEQKSLILEYSLPTGLNFQEKNSKYRLDVIKQAGTLKDQFDFSLSYPINMEVTGDMAGVKTGKQEISIPTDLLKDRSFEINFLKK